MGVSPQSPLTRSARAWPRQGVALPAILFAIIVVGMLGAMVFVMTDLHARSITNREQALRAGHVAESGLNHALGLLRGVLRDTTMTKLLRGPDGFKNTADDGLLINYGLPAASQIPLLGQTTTAGRYFVRVTDDPAETDGDPLTDANRRVHVTCRGVTLDGATTEVNVILSNMSLPGIAIDGNLEISGQLKITGDCGGMHANGSITGGGTPTVTKPASATGTVSVSVSPKLNNQPPLEMPELNPLDYCDVADYFKVGDFTLTNASPPGVYCVQGNASIESDIGTAANPKRVTIIATGAIQISAKPFLTAAHPEGILLMAGGDFDFQGDWGGDGGTGWNGDGLLYAGGHCYISSKPKIKGQLVCMSNPDPPGAIDYTDKNLISGDAEIMYGCGSAIAEFWRVVGWWPTIGS